MAEILFIIYQCLFACRQTESGMVTLSEALVKVTGMHENYYCITAGQKLQTHTIH